MSTSYFVGEGQSTNRPPLFNGSDYAYWKNRMTIYLQAHDYDTWRVILNGPYIPEKLLDHVFVPKKECEWDEHDIRKVQVNAKAMNCLHCALDRNEYNRISCCKSAKEIWDKLEVTHEGTSQVKKDKISMLIHQYELFKMNKGESIIDMFTRFTNITNSLSSLGKEFTNEENVTKVLRALPKEWQPKRTAMQESKRLETITMDELLGSLVTHELELKNLEEDEPSAKPQRSIALKASKNGEDYDENNPDEMTIMIARHFKKWMGKRNGKFNKLSKRKTYEKEEDSKSEPRCYGCQKFGHIKPNCPELKEKKERKWEKKNKEKKNKKAMQATWSESEESESDSDSSDEEIANLCLMAHGDDEVNSISNSCSNDDSSDDDNEHEFSYDELEKAFGDLLEAYEKNHEKFVKLKMKHASMSSLYDTCSSTIDELKSENETLRLELDTLRKEKCVALTQDFESENISLKEEVEDLKKILSNFTKGRDNLDKLLSSQRCVYDRAGLGYNPENKQKSFNNLFEKKPSHHTSCLCTICGRNTHDTRHCSFRKSTSMKKLAWVPKGTPMYTNKRGPNLFWVPKEVLHKNLV